MNPNKQFTSGKYFTSGASFTSGRFLSSGAALSSGIGDSQLLIGDEVGTQAPTAFRLAPRMYNLSREGTSGHILPGQVASAMAALPVQLAFRELGRDEHSRQCWGSDKANCWHWQLVVEQNNGSVVVTLTAAPATGDVATRLVWRPQAVWQPFGRNTLHPELVGNGVPPLIVRAP